MSTNEVQTGSQPTAPAHAQSAQKTNVLAVVSFVLGLLCFAVVPVILGHISLKQIKDRGEGGSVFAIIGLILGYLGVVVWLVLLGFLLISINYQVNNPGFYAN